MSTSTPATFPASADTAAADTARSHGRVRTIALIGGLLALLAVAAGAIAVNRATAYAFNGGEYTPARPAPELNLTDQDGNAFSLAEQRENVVLMYFGYTTCPDLCPTTLSDFQVVKDELGADADRVTFVLATFDPERDTPERLKEYLAFFDPEFIGLRGDAAQTEAFARAYGVTVERVDYPDSATGYLLNHTALIYVVDPQGNLRLSFPYGTDPALIAQDVRYLLNG